MNKLTFGIDFSLSDISIDETGKVIINNSDLCKIIEESTKSIMQYREQEQREPANHTFQCGCHNHAANCKCPSVE